MQRTSFQQSHYALHIAFVILEAGALPWRRTSDCLLPAAPPMISSTQRFSRQLRWTNAIAAQSWLLTGLHAAEGSGPENLDSNFDNTDLSAGIRIRLESSKDEELSAPAQPS